MTGSSFYFQQAEKNESNSTFLSKLESYAHDNKIQVFVIDKPLGDSKYIYEYRNAVVLLIPNYKIIFLDFANNSSEFENYTLDFIEDLGSISDKYRYKNTVGRSREWEGSLIVKVTFSEEFIDIENFLHNYRLTGGIEQKKCELLISLLTGSINNIDKVKGDVPDNILDKVKQKILLFDGDQTRFVYQAKDKPSITIQGLSGTGKTELLLHKLKEIYVGHASSKIMFTCHNHVLAHSLRKRIPEFFNFMKVEEQIKWNERLWCVNAWGSQSDADSGAYRYICNYYNLPSYRWSRSMSFERACNMALDEINTQELSPDKEFAFDFMLIDESQDFPESFFALCEKVTKSTVYIAGDIFQSIFDAKIVSSIEPDFLLSKCYRTDPRTLMFAHALGMGLFENPKLRWLEDNEWKACGYNVTKIPNNFYQLTREPLRRFEDLDSMKIQSMELIKTSNTGEKSVESMVLTIIRDLKSKNPTILAEDIGIIFVDSDNSIYALADLLEQSISREFDWEVNKAYESKAKIKDTIFISNKNNVKGLEFPFVICITDRISNQYHYRNALYMTLTRSFIKTYLLLSETSNRSLIDQLESGLNELNETGQMNVVAPTEEEKKSIKTTIVSVDNNKSWYDFIYELFDELKILPLFRSTLYDSLKHIIGDNFDPDTAKETIMFNYEKMSGSSK